MTVSSQVSSVEYATNGVTADFAIPFAFFSNADIQVSTRDASGDPTTLATGFTITGAGTGLGNCHLNPVLNNVTLVIERVPQFEQQTDYVENDRFPSATNEDDQDRQVMISQYLYRLLQGCVHFPTGDESIGVLSKLPTASNRKSTNLGFDAQGRLATSIALISSTLSRANIGAFLNVRSAGEIAASVIPTDFAYPEGDVRRYGADTLAVNNSAAINNALLVSANGGAAAYVPAGTWKITSPLVASLSSSMEGAGGTQSVIHATGSDGLQITAQPFYGGGRYFRGFGIIGHDAANSNNAAISITIASGRLTGIVFQDLNIANFAAAVYLHCSVSGQGGLWNSEFRNCFYYNCYQGYYFDGQVIQLQIEGGMVQTGAIAQPVSGPLSGIATRYGLFTGLGAGIQMQSLHCKGMGIYGYDTLVYCQYLFYGVFADCDLSQFAGSVGVQITTVQGNVVFDNTWIQAGNTNVSAVVGLKITDLGAVAPQKILVTGCNLRGNGVAGSIGIYCGSDQSAISIVHNTIGNLVDSFDYGVAGIGGTPGASSQNLVCKFNTIYALTADISVNTSCINSDIGPNVNQNVGVSTPFLCNTSPAGMRYTVPRMRGAATFVAATTVAVAFATPMPNATYGVLLSGNAAGYAWVTSKTANGFTINCSASNSNVTDWAVTYG